MGFFNNLSLRVKLNLIFAAIFLGVMVISTLVNVERERAYLLDVAKEQVVDLSTWYFDSLNTMMLTGTMEQRSILREKLLARNQVLEARVVRGAPVSNQYGAGLPEEQPHDELDRRALQGEQQLVVNTGEKGRVLTVLTPFKATENTRGVNCLRCHDVPAGTVNGAIRISYSLEHMDVNVANESLMNAVINMVLFGLGLILANVLVERWFSRPMNALMDVVRARGEGDIYARARVRTSDEIGRLAETFNNMADNVNSVNEREHEAALNLQRKVDNLLDVVNRVAEGDYEAKVGFSGEDAIGELAGSLQIMVDYIRLSIDEKREAVETLQRKVDLLLMATKQVAAGDLTGRISMQGEDAIAQLGEGVQGMIFSLNELVAQIQRSGVQVAASATEISASMTQLETTAEKQARTTNEIAATATEISATTKDLVGTMDEVAEVAEAASTSAADSHAGLERMQRIMSQLVDAVESVGEKLEILNEKASSISSVVTTISRVADQTNLLSLNASIEAEKAGETGRGFAVVATEIRRLADQAAVSTLDIDHMINEMQEAVSTGVDSIRRFTELVRSGVDEVQQVSRQQSDIIDQVETLSPRFEAVHQAMHFQSQGAEQINKAMIRINDSAQQTVDALRLVNRATLRLSDSAKGLQATVSRFKVKS